MTMSFNRLTILWTFLCTSGVVVAQQTPGCLFTMAQLLFNEDRVTDFTVNREYVICENREINIGTLDYDNLLVQGSGSRMLPLRPNLHLRCGGSGDRDNNCFFIGGDVQVDGTNFFGIPEDLTLDNIVIEGITFVGAGKYSIWATKRGDITFIDCEWRVSSSTVVARRSLERRASTLPCLTLLPFFCATGYHRVVCAPLL